jgi:hypothetical protein
MLGALRARGVDLNDFDAINATLQDLGPVRLPQPAPKRPKLPVASAVIRESAERAPALARFTTLVDFYGDGRKLTKTGQPTLADARALVSRLGIGDRFDEAIGARTFKTRSAAELLELGYTIRWAIAAGALRKEHGSLRATARAPAHVVRLGPRPARPHSRLGRHRGPRRRHRRGRQLGPDARTARRRHRAAHTGWAVVARRWVTRPLIDGYSHHVRRRVGHPT